MPHSFNKIWIHAIWATKFRAELIDFSIEKQVYDFIYQELVELGCPVRIINGMPDHIHALFLLNPNKSVADVLSKLKEVRHTPLMVGILWWKNFLGKQVLLPFQLVSLKLKKCITILKTKKHII